MIPIRKREQGQAVLPVLMAASVLLMGAAGFAIDLSNLYFQRQMAQAAADAAAQAAMMSIFDGTNGSGAAGFSTGGSFTCSASDARTPCQYARWNGFGTSADTVTVSFPASVSGVLSSVLSSSDPVNLVHVVVQRTVNTTLLKLLGTASSTASAAATAAIVTVTSPAPITVTDPNDSAFSCGGSCSITICGGPSRSIQVNSSSSSAVSIFGHASIDLSKAGPNDPGNCTTGTGGDFGVWGGPAGAPGGLNLGSTGQYVQPASPVQDPLASVSPPPVPSVTDPPQTTLPPGQNGCPTSSGGCTLYSPGLYTSFPQVKNETALFKPGIYYIQNGGFSNGANGDMEMATGFTDGPSGTNTGWTENMLVYNTGTGTFNFGANSSANLIGSPANSAYQGILFFEDRSAPSQPHDFTGGGNISLQGTIYLTNSMALMTGSSPQFQTLSIRGHGGSSTFIQGEIIVSKLDASGAGGIQMNLTTNAVQVRQVALVQ